MAGNNRIVQCHVLTTGPWQEMNMIMNLKQVFLKEKDFGKSKPFLL